MAPRHAGWKALADAVTPGAHVTRLRRLAGAGMTDAYDVTLDRTPRRVVVKLCRDGDGTAPLEWSRLEFAQVRSRDLHVSRLGARQRANTIR